MSNSAANSQVLSTLAQNTEPPVVSFGLPVYNAEKYLSRLFDSLLAQDLQAIEVVVSDNGSTDRTEDICEEYVRRGLCVRYYRNRENLGQIANFNRVLELARGKYFRWLGADDWLEPEYTRRCVEALETQPEFVGVTTYQDHIHDDGKRDYSEYRGERLDSPSPHVRFQRMGWFMTAGHYTLDPIYTMMRRDILLATHRLQILPNTDQVLAMELSLFGPWTHVPACLAHRRREPIQEINWEEVHKRYHPTRYQELHDPHIRMATSLFSVLRSAPISLGDKLRCIGPVLRFTWVRVYRRTYWTLRGMPGRVRRALKSAVSRQK